MLLKQQAANRCAHLEADHECTARVEEIAKADQGRPAKRGREEGDKRTLVVLAVHLLLHGGPQPSTIPVLPSSTVPIQYIITEQGYTLRSFVLRIHHVFFPHTMCHTS